MKEALGHGGYIPALKYRWLTPFYDTIVGATTRERTFKTALIAQAEIQPDHCILDLACGTGTLSIWIKESHAEASVFGIDGDPDILAIALRKAQLAKTPIVFERAMSYDLPFPDNHFDCVVSSLFFHHLRYDDKVRTVNEIFRVLKPGGQLHVADWGRAENFLMRTLFFLVQLLDGFENTQDNVAGKLPRLFENGGFLSVAQRDTFRTMFGTMALYCASKPA